MAKQGPEFILHPNFASEHQKEVVDEAPTQVSLPAPGLGSRQHGWTLSAFTTVKDRCHLWTTAGIAAHMLQSKRDVVPLGFSTLDVSWVRLLSHHLLAP